MGAFVEFDSARMPDPTYYVYQTPLGRVSIQARGDAITRMQLGAFELEGSKRATSATNNAATQVQEYLAGKRTSFDLDLAPEGSDFQRQVWSQLCEIPYGQTRTYGQVAEALGNPNAFRAVGGAANRNPILLAIPCHRVVGADGGLVGYASGLHVKRYLLDLEASSS